MRVVVRDGELEQHVETCFQEVYNKFEGIKTEGSGFTFYSVDAISVDMVKAKPSACGTFFPSPKHLGRNLINIRNDDDYCFLYCILAHLYPANNNKHRVNNYTPYLNELNYNELSFPLKVKDISKFETMNPNISINVLTEDIDDNSIIPIRMSKYRRAIHINLFLLHEEATGKNHYTLVSNLRGILNKNKGYNNNREYFYCKYCFHSFSFDRLLATHELACQNFISQRIVLPSPGMKCSFKNIYKCHPVEFALYCDFEAFLSPVENDPKVLSNHVPSGYCVKRVSRSPYILDPPAEYLSGENIMDDFFNCLKRHQREIDALYSKNEPMFPLSEREVADFNSQNICPYCEKIFNDDVLNDRKVHHHCHITGRFIRACCSQCNLQLKARRKSERFRVNRAEIDETNDFDDAAGENYIDDGWEGEDDGDRNGGIFRELKYKGKFFIPVIFHNLSKYDSRIILKHLARHFPDDEISAIPSNTETFISFQLGSLRFLDSLRFLNASLDTLVSNMAKNGTEGFKITSELFPGESLKLMTRKGVFPYEYFDSLERFDETELPPIHSFFSALNDSHISIEDYAHAQKVWQHFNMRTFKQYHDVYLLSDVVLLADVFENFRTLSLKYYGLDPLHYYTTPGLTWDASLKKTKVEMELLSDESMQLFIERGVRGGVCQISNRRASSNIPDSPTYDPVSPSSFLMYLDCNNLYGYSMSQDLPTGAFEWVESVENFDLYANEKDIGYILEVDLDYPAHLHDVHNDFPLAPERRSVALNELSPYCSLLLEKIGGKHVPSPKLLTTFYKKERYVLHINNLRFYLEKGLILTKIYKILKFKQSPWLAQYIRFNTERRKEATTSFEKDFFKLLNNAVYGKCLENVRNRVNVKLVRDGDKALKLTSRPNFESFIVISDDLLFVKMSKPVVKIDKPSYVGMCILELSKLHMYKFHYDVMKVKYGERLKMCFTDTDSLFYQIETEDVYSDLIPLAERYLDTSDYPRDHPLYSNRNAKTIGLFKDELNGGMALEFIGLRAKMYSILLPDHSHKATAKGIKNSFLKNHLTHESYKSVLDQEVTTTARFQNIVNYRQGLRTVNIHKTCLSPFDDKRYILGPSGETLAYGHYKIRR